MMQPLKHKATLAALELPASLAQGNGTVPLSLQAGLLFLQEDGSQQGQGPEAYNGRGAHQLIVIQAQFLFAILEQDFDIPACRDMGEQGLRIGLEITGGPEA